MGRGRRPPLPLPPDRTPAANLPDHHRGSQQNLSGTLRDYFDCDSLLGWSEIIRCICTEIGGQEKFGQSKQVGENEEKVKVRKDLKGEVFGQLVVLKGNGRKVLCRCKCGKRKSIFRGSLHSGNTKSCGHIHREQLVARNLKHGLAKRKTKLPPELISYYGGRDRCTRKKNKSYPYYGGRGLTFDFKSFQDFLAALRSPENPSGLRPTQAHSLDRIDNSKGYGIYAGKSNIRWATKSQQMRNRRGWALATA